jgi:hypothetical protein
LGLIEFNLVLFLGIYRFRATVSGLENDSLVRKQLAAYAYGACRETCMFTSSGDRWIGIVRFNATHEGIT